MKTFKINGIEYMIAPCTAICAADGGDERKRQDALLVSNEYNGELFESVVFGYDVPKTAETFAEMCEDYSAWESDCTIIRKAQRKCA